MSQYPNFKFSVTVHTDDRELIGCLSALAHCCEPVNPRQIYIEGQIGSGWERNEHQATFHFSNDQNRESFIDFAKKHYAHSLKIIEQKDNNPPGDSN